MATYNSDQITNATPIPGEGAGGGQEKATYFRVSVPVGATTTDVLPLCYLPPNARVLGGAFKNDALGGGTINIGDTGGGVDPATGTAIAANAARYFSAQAVTNAGTNVTFAAAGRYFRNGKAKTLVQMTFATGPTTTAGVVEGHITFTVEEPQ